MPRAKICADCAEYRREGRMHGSCAFIAGAPISQLDEARQRRVVRWNNLACKHYSERPSQIFSP